MYNQSEFLDASGNLDREAVRAHFLRTRRLEGLVKGDVVYVDWFGKWEQARLVRRLPGDVWTAKLLFVHPFAYKTVVTSENFGGKCAS